MRTTSVISKRYFLFLFFLMPAMASLACDTTKTITCKVFYDNGKIKSQSLYKNGVRHGVWVTYDTLGRLLTKTKYKRGKRIWMFTYKDNKVIETINRKGKVKKVKDCGC